jgi:peptidoglycan/xylan/chitin deacetylase (PgdA/CDA1 family)
MSPRLPPRPEPRLPGLRVCALAATVLGCPVVFAQNADQADNAVILLYHHVSVNTPASTSVTPEVFEQHLQYLVDGYNVIPLEQAINRLGKARPLPEKAVVITFDDGYRNIYDNAHPLLLKYKLPYTVFVNPQLIGNSSHQLSWQQALEMERGGARFANHTSQHRHLLERAPGTSQSQWLSGVEQDILSAEAVLRENLGYSPGYVAYPYGEYNADIQNLVSSMGMIGFGQHSGAVYSGSDFTALPRFPAAGIYANLNTLKVKINSLAMPVATADARDEAHTASKENDFSFSYTGQDVVGDQIGCFFGARPLAISREGQAVKVTVDRPLPVGRSRVNCTAPSASQPGRYYWYSQPRFIPAKDGTYPD